MSWRRHIGTAAILSLLASACSTPTTGSAVQDLPASETAASETAASETTVGSELAGNEGSLAEDGLLCTPAPVDTTSVHVNPMWDVGSYRDIQIVSKKTAGGQNSFMWTNHARVWAQDKTADSYSFVWNEGPTSLFINDEPVTSSAGRVTAGVLDGVDVHYELNPTSAPADVTNVTNVADLRPLITARLSRRRDQQSDGVKEAQARRIAHWNETSDEGWVRHFSPGPDFYHRIDDTQLEVGGRTFVDSQIKNPYDVEMIRAKDIRSIEELIDEDGCVLIKIVTVADSVQLRSLLLDIFHNAEIARDARVESETFIQYDYHAHRVLTVISRVAYTRGPGTDFQEFWLTDVTID